MRLKLVDIHMGQLNWGINQGVKPGSEVCNQSKKLCCVTSSVATIIAIHNIYHNI